MQAAAISLPLTGSQQSEGGSRPSALHLTGLSSMPNYSFRDAHLWSATGWHGLGAAHKGATVLLLTSLPPRQERGCCKAFAMPVDQKRSPAQVTSRVSVVCAFVDSFSATHTNRGPGLTRHYVACTTVLCCDSYVAADQSAGKLICGCNVLHNAFQHYVYSRPNPLLQRRWHVESIPLQRAGWASRSKTAGSADLPSNTLLTLIMKVWGGRDSELIRCGGTLNGAHGMPEIAV